MRKIEQLIGWLTLRAALVFSLYILYLIASAWVEGELQGGKTP